jgi:hypothetical protein
MTGATMLSAAADGRFLSDASGTIGTHSPLGTRAVPAAPEEPTKGQKIGIFSSNQGSCAHPRWSSLRMQAV